MNRAILNIFKSRKSQTLLFLAIALLLAGGLSLNPVDSSAMDEDEVKIIFEDDAPTEPQGQGDEDEEDVMRLAQAQCPQPRKTVSAPEPIFSTPNPFAHSPEAIQKGEEIFQQTAGPLNCALCHGTKGDGVGDVNFATEIPARNFTCAETMKNIPDGQLFWVIRNGSQGTAMMPYSDLGEESIWQVVAYIRALAK